MIGYVVVKTGSLWPGVLFHMTHNGLSVLQARLTPDLHESQPLLRWLFVPGFEAGTLLYSLPATIVLGSISLVLLWWLKSLPYHRSAEERLQEALDHQAPLPSAL